MAKAPTTVDHQQIAAGLRPAPVTSAPSRRPKVTMVITATDDNAQGGQGRAQQVAANFDGQLKALPSICLNMRRPWAVMILIDQAIFKMNDAVAVFGHVAFVRDHHDGQFFARGLAWPAGA